LENLSSSLLLVIDSTTSPCGDSSFQKEENLIFPSLVITFKEGCLKGGEV
jgi:hypothetical protein